MSFFCTGSCSFSPMGYKNRRFIIGFDRSLRVLEVITVLKINGEEIVIHAMKATQKVIAILQEIQNGI